MADVQANVDKVFNLYQTHGELLYLGENVSQTSHSIQCAMNAEKDSQPVQVVLGALLHDIGNLVGKDTDTEHIIINDVNIGPKNHDAIGANFLETHGFPHEIVVFASQHANAIRYMAWKDPEYAKSLSWTSKAVLERRGGPFTDAEGKAFEALPHYDAIIKCRKWDEGAKAANAPLKPLGDYRKMALEYLQSKK